VRPPTDVLEKRKGFDGEEPDRRDVTFPAEQRRDECHDAIQTVERLPSSAEKERGHEISQALDQDFDPLLVFLRRFTRVVGLRPQHDGLHEGPHDEEGESTRDDP